MKILEIGLECFISKQTQRVYGKRYVKGTKDIVKEDVLARNYSLKMHWMSVNA